MGHWIFLLFSSVRVKSFVNATECLFVWQKNESRVFCLSLTGWIVSISAAEERLRSFKICAKIWFAHGGKCVKCGDLLNAERQQSLLTFASASISGSFIVMPLALVHRAITGKVTAPTLAFAQLPVSFVILISRLAHCSPSLNENKFGQDWRNWFKNTNQMSTMINDDEIENRK